MRKFAKYCIVFAMAAKLSGNSFEAQHFLCKPDAESQHLILCKPVFQNKVPVPAMYMVHVRDLPLDRGELTLTFTRTFLERLAFDPGCSFSDEAREIDRYVDRPTQNQMFSTMMGHFATHVTHTVPQVYFLPGERAKLRIANHDQTWSDVVSSVPDPIIAREGDKHIEAELLGLIPLVYRINFRGFRADDRLTLTTQTSKRKTRAENFAPGAHNYQFHLMIANAEKLERKPIQFEVRTSQRETLKLNLPTMKMLSALSTTLIDTAPQRQGPFC